MSEAVPPSPTVPAPSRAGRVAWVLGGMTLSAVLGLGFANGEIEERRQRSAPWSDEGDLLGDRFGIGGNEVSFQAQVSWDEPAPQSEPPRWTVTLERISGVIPSPADAAAADLVLAVQHDYGDDCTLVGLELATGAQRFRASLPSGADEACACFTARVVERCLVLTSPIAPTTAIALDGSACPLPVERLPAPGTTCAWSSRSRWQPGFGPMHPRLVGPAGAVELRHTGWNDALRGGPPGGDALLWERDMQFVRADLDEVPAILAWYGDGDSWLGAVDLRTGRSLWRRRRTNVEAVTRSTSWLAVSGERGVVELVEASTGRHLGRLKEPER